MKKLLLSLTIGVLSVATMYGQGRVAFNNQSTFANADAVIVGVNNQGASGGAAGNGIGSPSYSVQLRWVAGTIGTQAAFEAANPTSSGVFSGAIFLAPTGPLSTFAGFFDAGVVPIGATLGNYTMQARAWFSTGFATYDLAVAGGRNTGQSGLFNVNVTAAPTPVNSTIFPGFTVGAAPIVPEPSTFALAGLGAAALLFLRRRK